MRSPTILLAAALSLLAAGIHAAVMPHHFEESTAQGIFFLVLALAQTVLAVELVRKPRHLILLGGIFGNSAVLIVYIVSRTIGVPGGAHGVEAEPVGLLDSLASLSEILLIALLAMALRNHPDIPNDRAGAPAPSSSHREPPPPRACHFTVNA